MGGAAGGIRAVAVRIIERYALAAGTSHEFADDSLSQAGREHRIKVVEEGTELLKVVIDPLLVAKGKLRVVAEATLADAGEADAGVDPALFRRRQIALGSGSVLGGDQDAGTDSNVNLLGMGESAKRQKRTHGQEQRELSQIQPPFSFVQFYSV